MLLQELPNFVPFECPGSAGLTFRNRSRIGKGREKDSFPAYPRFGALDIVISKPVPNEGEGKRSEREILRSDREILLSMQKISRRLSASRNDSPAHYCFE